MCNGEELAEAALEGDEGGSTQVPGDDQGEHASVSSPSVPAQTGFVAYEAIRDALIARGIAPHEIAFIQDATTRARREQLMAAVRSGAIRVLLAGSQNTGLNVQDRLLAVHNVDVPWRPGDLEQRIGRAQRQGNMWPEVFVCNYATEHSFDSYMWQANEVKAGFIEQFERGEVTTREIDDIGGIVMTAAEMKAIASGNAQVRRKFQVESELARLDLLHVAWRTTQRTMQGRISEIENQCAQTRANQALLDAAQTAIEAAATREFHALVAQTIGSEPTVLMNKRVEAGATVRDLAATICQLHGIQQLEQHELWAWMLEQRVVLAQYRGLLVECLVGKFKQAVVMLSLRARGEPALLPETALASTTGRGVFDSADAAIRQFPARIAEYERRIESLTAERHTILAALEQPWEHEATYRALTEERDELFRALGPKDNPAPAEVDAKARARDDTPDTTPPPEPAVPMVDPPVILPPLSDPAAMEAAREQIKARDRERMARRGDAAVGSRAIVGANATHQPLITLEEPGLAEQAHLDAVRALYQPAGKVVFGDVEAAKQRRKGAKQTTQDEEPEQLSLFG